MTSGVQKYGKEERRDGKNQNRELQCYSGRREVDL
jgi:hypothetical protein